jgi:hypothetical protein
MARWCGSSTPAELRARRGRSLGLSTLEEKEDSSGGSERAHGHQQLKAGAWARGQAAAAARRATPAHGRHAAGVLCRGRGVARRLARLAGEGASARGWAGPRRRLRRARGVARADSASGPKARRRPV